jgi:hypothetical protein
MDVKQNFVLRDDPWIPLDFVKAENNLINVAVSDF